MLSYVVRRLLYAIPILIGASLVTFILFYATATPEQMARRNISAKNPSKEQIQEWIVEHGYDKPRHEQFTKHMRELLLFQFGKADAPPHEEIWSRIRRSAPVSLYLGSAIFFTSLVASIFFALWVAYF